MELTTPRTLAECEADFERGFQIAARALVEIRDNRLYREAGYTSFDTYCRERRGMRRDMADKLIAASGVVNDLHTNGMESLPTSERQARPLAKLPTAQDRSEAWQEAVETAPNGKVTAKHVEQVVRARVEPTQQQEPDSDRLTFVVIGIEESLTLLAGADTELPALPTRERKTLVRKLKTIRARVESLLQHYEG